RSKFAKALSVLGAAYKPGPKTKWRKTNSTVKSRFTAGNSTAETGPLVFFEGFSINGFARISGKWLPNPTTFGRLFLRFYQRDGFSLKLSSGELVAVVPKAYAIDVNLESGMEAWVNDLLH